MDINRINELARKKKAMGLTEEETAEQAKLRAEYLVEFRGNFKQQLDNVYIVDEKGNKEKITDRSSNRS